MTLLKSLPKPNKYVEIENAERLRVLPSGKQVSFYRVDFNILMYSITTYTLAYFFLSCCLGLTFVMSESNKVTNCTIPVLLWSQYSAYFYLSSFIATTLCAFYYRNRTLTYETVTIKSLIIVFQNVEQNWFYLVLTLIEIVNLFLTIFGTTMNLSESHDQMLICYLELPMVCNFMYVLIILGYLNIFRFLTTLLHFRFGIHIYRWLRNHFSYLRNHDLNMKAKFPIYNFDQYSEYMQ